MKKLMVVLFLFVALAGCGESTTAISTPTGQPTTKPTTQPATSKFASVAGPARIGSPIGTFAQYGQPNTHTDSKAGSYHFQKYADSNTDTLIVQTDLIDKGYSDVVDGVSVQADNAGWTPEEATTMVAKFLPTDAQYQKQVPLSTGNGTDKIYYSATLAKQLPADEFTDASTNQIKAGTFDVQCLTNNGNVDSCNIQVGTQQAQ
jgi:hypothetical protein